MEPDTITIKYILNFLKLCQSLLVLADKFQDIIINLAEHNNLLIIWA